MPELVAVWTDAAPRLASPCRSCPQGRGDKDLCAADCRARIEYFCRIEDLNPRVFLALLSAPSRFDPEGQKTRQGYAYEYTCRFCLETFQVTTTRPSRRRTVCGASRCYSAWTKERWEKHLTQSRQGAKGSAAGDGGAT